MNLIDLTSYEFRSYRTSTGTVSLCLRSYLLVFSRDSGHISYFFDNPVAKLRLKNTVEVSLSCCWTLENEFGAASPDCYQIALRGEVERKRFATGPSKLSIDYASSHSPDIRGYSFRHDSIVRPLPNYRDQ